MAGVACAATPTASSPPARLALALSSEARSAPPRWVTALTCGSLAVSEPETVRAVASSVALQTMRACCEQPLSWVIWLLWATEARTTPSVPVWALLSAMRSLSLLSSCLPCAAACLKGDLVAGRRACPCLASQPEQDGSPVAGPSGLGESPQLAA